MFVPVDAVSAKYCPLKGLRGLLAKGDSNDIGFSCRKQRSKRCLGDYCAH